MILTPLGISAKTNIMDMRKPESPPGDSATGHTVGIKYLGTRKR